MVLSLHPLFGPTLISYTKKAQNSNRGSIPAYSLFGQFTVAEGAKWRLNKLPDTDLQIHRESVFPSKSLRRYATVQGSITMKGIFYEEGTGPREALTRM